MSTTFLLSKLPFFNAEETTVPTFDNEMRQDVTILTDLSTLMDVYPLCDDMAIDKDFLKMCEKKGHYKAMMKLSRRCREIYTEICGDSLFNHNIMMHLHKAKKVLSYGLLDNFIPYYFAEAVKGNNLSLIRSMIEEGFITSRPYITSICDAEKDEEEVSGDSLIMEWIKQKNWFGAPDNETFSVFL